MAVHPVASSAVLSRVATGAVLGRVLVAVAVVAGAAVHLWIMVSPVGAFDADSAVPGLMARRLLDGELTTFYWGQAYGGSLDAAVAAVLFAVLPPSPFLVKLVPVLFTAGSMVLVWRIGLRTVGEPAARVGALLLWVWPAAFLWWSTKIGGSYHSSLFLTLLALLLLLRLVQQEGPWRPLDVALLGFVAGLAFWSNVQALLILVPAFLWHAAAWWRAWRHVPVLIAGFLVGAAPWIRFNALYGWPSLHPPPMPKSTYWTRFDKFFEYVLPQALGLRRFFTLAWVGDGVGRVLYVLALAALVVAVVQVVRRRAPGMGVLVFTALLFPFLYSFSPFALFIHHPRYVLFLTPAVGLLLGKAVASIPWPAVPAVGLIGIAGVSSFLMLQPLNEGSATLPAAPDVAQPLHFDDLVEVLDAHNVRYAFADYWLAYRATFEAEERTLVTPLYAVRHRGIDEEVRGSDRPAYIFLAASRTRARFEERAAELGVGYETHSNGPFVVLVPQRRLLPEELGIDWVRPG